MYHPERPNSTYTYNSCYNNLRHWKWSGLNYSTNPNGYITQEDGVSATKGHSHNHNQQRSHDSCQSVRWGNHWNDISAVRFLSRSASCQCMVCWISVHEWEGTNIPQWPKGTAWCPVHPQECRLGNLQWGKTLMVHNQHDCCDLSRCHKWRVLPRHN